MNPPSGDARELVRGGFDLHLHIAPDVIERRIDDVALARRFAELGLVLALSDAGFDELFEARKLVEPRLAALAAERATDAEIARLAECAEASASGVGDDDAFMRADLELHAIIAAAARNAILARVVGSLAGLGVASRMATTHLEGMQERVVRDHRRIAAAIAARDAEAAERALRAHLGEVVEALRR